MMCLSVRKSTSDGRTDQSVSTPGTSHFTRFNVSKLKLKTKIQ
jgi:hypothetical protein